MEVTCKSKAQNVVDEDKLEFISKAIEYYFANDESIPGLCLWSVLLPRSWI